MSNTNESPSSCQIMIPVVLVALSVFLSLGFQALQIKRDRDALTQVMVSQDKQIEASKKLQGQLSGLMLGTKKLADEGNKNAAAIMEKLQQNGVSVGPVDGAPAAPAAGGMATSPAGATVTPAPAQ